MIKLEKYFNVFKNMLSGLLTVNPDERLTVDEVSEHEWFKHAGNTPETPLATPTVLSLAAGEEAFSSIFKNITCTGQTFNETINAFLTANKEGFHLADVAAAPLAQRRRRKGQTGTVGSGLSTSSSTLAADSSSGDAGSSGGRDNRKRKLFAVLEEVSC